PPLSQQREHLRRQHDVPVFAALRLNDTDDHLRAVDVAGLEANDLTGPQTAAIAEREHGVNLEIAGHGKEPIGLVWAHGQRQLLRLLEVVDLGCEIVPPQRDAEQELHPGHDAVAIGYAEAGFDQMQLEAANV